MDQPLINPHALADYLAKLHGAAVHHLTLTRLGLSSDKSSNHKGYGYGRPIRLSYKIDQTTHHRVLHTTAPGPFGHEHMADRAAGWLWAHRAFNRLPGHVRSYDIAAILHGGLISSLGDVTEFLLLTDYAQGIPYGEDLNRLGIEDVPSPKDLQRCDVLCDYLLMVHAERKSDRSLYQRSIRQLVGHHECIFGLIDSYTEEDPVAPPSRLQSIEEAVIDWRWRLKHRSHRLRRVHGDFHPWNLIFDDENQLSTLDRSRGEYGDPADDVVAVTINYLFQSLVCRGRFTGACRALFDRFWQYYLTASDDWEMLSVVAPFFAFRGLVLASPIWYPNTPGPIRSQILRLIERVLNQDRFEPDRIDEYLITNT